MKLTKINIPSDGLNLSGLAYEGADRKGMIAVLSHGFTASRAGMDLLAAYLTQKGTPCITFDARGHKLGASGGEVENIGQLVDDLRAAIAFAQKYFDCNRVVLAGHSMGGILSMAAANTPGVEGVAVITAGPNPGAGFKALAGEAMLAMRSDYVEGIPAIQFLEELSSIVHAVDQLGGIPTLFIAAKGDVLVRSSKVQEMADRAGPLHQFREVEGSHQEAPDKARGAIGNWIARQFYESA